MAEVKAWDGDDQEVVLVTAEDGLRIWEGHSGKRTKKKLTVIPHGVIEDTVEDEMERRIQALRDQGFMLEGEKAVGQSAPIAYFLAEGNAENVDFSGLGLKSQVVSNDLGSVIRIEGSTIDFNIPLKVDGRRPSASGTIHSEWDLGRALVIQDFLERQDTDAKVLISDEDGETLLTASNAVARHPGIRPILEEHGVVLKRPTESDMDAPEWFF